VIRRAILAWKSRHHVNDPEELDAAAQAWFGGPAVRTRGVDARLSSSDTDGTGHRPNNEWTKKTKYYY
jgi:hypothetical protein